MKVATTRPGLELRSFVPDDGAAYAELLRSNSRHLTRHGNYTDAVTADAADLAATFAAGDPLHTFGIYETGQLAGSVTLVPVDPPKFGLGFLLAEQACGRGIATLAVHAIAGHARRCLAATDLFAGVTHGNVESVAVLRRVGFDHVEAFEDYDRHHLDLTHR